MAANDFIFLDSPAGPVMVAVEPLDDGTGRFALVTTEEASVQIDSYAYLPGSGPVPVAVEPLDDGTGRFALVTSPVGGGVVSIPADGWVPFAATCTYASADAPTFTFTVTADLRATLAVGMRWRYTQGGTIKYGIITAIAYVNPSTTVTIYGGTDYVLANAAISETYYSPTKAPLGFPLNPAKWTVEVSDTTQRSQATPTQNAWYNLGAVSISIPIGAWMVEYHVVADSRLAAGSSAYTTLSTANNSESDAQFTTYAFVTATIQMGPHSRQKVLVLSVKTAYYLNTKTGEASVTLLLNRNDNAPAIIRAICAYL